MAPQLDPIGRLAQMVDYLVDDRVGIIRQVNEVPREAGTPDFFHVVAQACDTRAFTEEANFANSGGASVDRGEALAKAIGEAVERYCSAMFDPFQLPLFPSDDAPFPCTRPAEYALYSEAQLVDTDFPWAPFEPETPVRWTAAVDLCTGEQHYVPAAMVFIPYRYYLDTGEVPIVQPISTGLACHCSKAEATRAAICEVVERDAFTIAWQAMISAPHILVESLSDTNYRAVERFERTGSDVTLLNITLDAGIPTALAVLRSDAPAAPALVLAAASDPDPERAVRKSLEELAHTRRYSQQIKTRMPRLEADSPLINVNDQVDHLNFWTDQQHARLADFIFASSERVPFETLENLATGDAQRDVEMLVARINTVGHRVLVADVTTEDVADVGLSVVRAVIPGFHPLFMGHRLRALGGNRLWDVPQRLGYSGINRERGDNPAPHPYP
jgi:ribosomal protein S12 methylthiotransferase accessory factor